MIRQWVDFGLELKWRLCVHEHGAKLATKEFMLPTHGGLSCNAPGTSRTRDIKACFDAIPVEADRVAVTAAAISLLHELIIARTGENDLGPEDQEGAQNDALAPTSSKSTKMTGSSGAGWAKVMQQQLGQWDCYFSLAAGLYTQIPVLTAKLAEFANLVTTSMRQSQLVRLDDFVAKVRGYHKVSDKASITEWQAQPVFVKYYETKVSCFGTVGHNGDAALTLWLSSQLLHRGRRAAIQSAKSVAVLKLLAMSPSAIHLNIVWRFLVRHRQDLLGPFLDPDTELHGIFFRSSLDSGCSDSDSDSDSDGGGFFEEDEDDEADLPKPFMLPATYGLHRLRQADAAILASRWRTQVDRAWFNPGFRRLEKKRAI